MKRMNHQVEMTIQANPQIVWEIIGSGKDVDQWLAPITTCVVEGNKRYCGTEEGSFEEDILESNEETMTFRYFIPTQHLLPVENIEGQMQVFPLEGEGVQVRWRWTYDIAEENVKAVQEGLNQVGEMGIKGIEALAQKRQTQQI